MSQCIDVAGSEEEGRALSYLQRRNDGEIMKGVKDRSLHSNISFKGRNGKMTISNHKGEVRAEINGGGAITIKLEKRTGGGEQREVDRS